MTGTAYPNPWPHDVNYYVGHERTPIPEGEDFPRCDTCKTGFGIYGTKSPGKNPHHGVELVWCNRCYMDAATQARVNASDFDMAIGLDPAPEVIRTYYRPYPGHHHPALDI